MSRSNYRLAASPEERQAWIEADAAEGSQRARAILARQRRQQQRLDFEAAHAEGLHDETSREGCPLCDNQPRRR